MVIDVTWEQTKEERKHSYNRMEKHWTLSSAPMSSTTLETIQVEKWHHLASEPVFCSSQIVLINIKDATSTNKTTTSRRSETITSNNVNRKSNLLCHSFGIQWYWFNELFVVDSSPSDFMAIIAPHVGYSISILNWLVVNQFDHMLIQSDTFPWFPKCVGLEPATDCDLQNQTSPEAMQQSYPSMREIKSSV